MASQVACAFHATCNYKPGVYRQYCEACQKASKAFDDEGREFAEHDAAMAKQSPAKPHCIVHGHFVQGCIGCRRMNEPLSSPNGDLAVIIQGGALSTNIKTTIASDDLTAYERAERIKQLIRDAYDACGLGK